MSKAKKSAKQLLLGSLVSKAFAFIGSILLAHILLPEDFGYLLMTMLVTAFAQQIGNMGFENFYLQEKIEDEEHEKKILNITFKLRVGVNIILFLFQFFGSYLVEKYFNEKIVGELLRIFSFEYLIMTLTQINLYILRKKLEYKPEVYANFSRDIVGTITKVALAYNGFAALSFAIGSLIGSFIRMIVLLKFQSFRPDLKDWDKEIFLKVFFFGKHSLISGLTLYLSNYIDKILLAKFFSIEIVGLYSFSSNQAKIPSSYLVLPQGSLILSYISNHKYNSKNLIKKLLNTSYFLAIVMLPIISFLLIFSDPLIKFIFGDKWIDSVVLFQVFLIYYYIHAVQFPFTGILTGYGRPDILSKLNIFTLALMTILLYLVGTFNNIFYFVLIYTIVSTIIIFLKTYLGFRIMKQDLRLIVQTYKYITLSMLLCSIFYFILSFYSLNKLLILTIVFVMFYVVLIILDKSNFFNSLDVFLDKFKTYKSVRNHFFET